MAVTFTGGVQVPAMLGNNALTQHLFSIENGIGSRVDVDVRKILYQMDAIAVLTSVTSQVKATRATGISGGVVLDKAAFLTTQTSDPFVKIRSAMGEGAPITATMGTTTVWQSFAPKMYTAIGRQTRTESGILPRLVRSDSWDFKLRPGESLLLSVIGAAVTTNAALTTNWLIDCAWEEDAKSTFAISGTITLSGSPVAGARVIVMESDDVDGTNMFLRETIVTGAGGTWASSILTGKIGAAFVQYESGGTYYTAPGSPFLS